MQASRVVGHACIDENASLFSEVDALVELLSGLEIVNQLLLEQAQLCANPQRLMVCAAVHMYAHLCICLWVSALHSSGADSL